MESNTISVTTVQTTPYTDQKAGTSGLRKKVSVFKQENYLENFVQSIFDSLKDDEVHTKSLVLSGDGRYYNDIAIQKIAKMAAARGFGKVVIGQNGLLSTPAVSAVIRQLNKEVEGSCTGGIVLTASHNPGGENNDFGIKFNSSNGGPALENLTDAFFSRSKEISEYKYAELPEINLTEIHQENPVQVEGYEHEFIAEVISSTDIYVSLLKSLFDFDSIKALMARSDFNFAYDGMSGVAGPYARTIFEEELGVPAENLYGCDPSPDFEGGHPDPNLTYAENLVKVMGVTIKGANVATDTTPDFGAAADGDADRNMVLGKGFFITPSDSLAIITANHGAISYMKDITGVARSMPTSGAVDIVAKELGIDVYETPTGWKFFGNLLDADKIVICGEESFGTGSNHIREKDGIWAVLAWLSIIAHKNSETTEGNLVSAEQIVRDHWKKFGRNYYSRYDYENLETETADKIFETLESKMEQFRNEEEGNVADIFEYTDSVDGSSSKNQGWRFMYKDGSRFIFRKSGTGSSGATIRIYLESYNKDNTELETAEALKNLSEKALEYCEINEISGREGPTVIT
ncbi:unnamed protein product [Moneuplotes crassus]|uniref:phosphoglucomutase (alpha-D-glucose-1,6-bisphosphate-dependent) n=1 Tax=Euplotes crassus TaxID=5936 RepID=A0AAD1U8D0_EUPCR|nr:unnamed protein product [Moneuplotes crassus]